MIPISFVDSEICPACGKNTVRSFNKSDRIVQSDDEIVMYRKCVSCKEKFYIDQDLSNGSKYTTSKDILINNFITEIKGGT